MKRFRGWLIFLIILAGGIAGFLWFRNRAQTGVQSQEILRTADVARGDLAITVSASGNSSVNERIDLRFSIPGTVEHVAVDVNERVEAGQELARLDAADLERAAQQSRIALEQAQLNLDILTKPPAEEDLELARLAVQSAMQSLEVARLGKQTSQADANNMIVQAQRARENAFKDLQSVAGTPAEESARSRYDSAEEQEHLATINAELTVEQAQAQWLAAYNAYQQAEENLNRLEQGPDANQVRQAELQIEQAQLNLEQAQSNLADAALKAPFAGLVVAVNAQEGMQAPVSSPAFTLVDDTAFYIDITVDEIDIGKVAVGQSVAATLDAYPNTPVSGTVETIAPSSINIGGIVAYRVKVHLTETGDVVLRDGMTASVVIHTGTIEDILLVPNWAIRTDQSDQEPQLYCYVLRGDGTLERRSITLGRYSESFTEVIAGLEEGDIVALVPEERSLFDLGGPPSRN